MNWTKAELRRADRHGWRWLCGYRDPVSWGLYGLVVHTISPDRANLDAIFDRMDLPELQCWDPPHPARKPRKKPEQLDMVRARLWVPRKPGVAAATRLLHHTMFLTYLASRWKSTKDRPSHYALGDSSALHECVHLVQGVVTDDKEMRFRKPWDNGLVAKVEALEQDLLFLWTMDQWELDYPDDGPLLP